MRRNGFILAGAALYGAIAAAAVISVMGLSLWFTTVQRDNARKELARVEGEYEAFKATAERLGREAQERYNRDLMTRERIANERIKSLGLRAAAAAARADGLCKQAGLRSGCRALPAVPDTARPTDDTGFNERLLEVLRHAQAVADQLAELQAWVAAQQAAR